MADYSNPIPEGIDIVQDGMNAVIRRPWFNHTVWFLLIFCIFWDAFLVFWYAMAFIGGSKGPASLMMVLFPLIHVAVGVGLTYFVICTFLNKTDIILEPSQIRVKTHPLPWPGNVTLNAAELVSFRTRKREHQGRNRSAVTYDILYVNTANREKTLIRTLRKQEQAEYIVNSLTKYYLPGNKTST